LTDHDKLIDDWKPGLPGAWAKSSARLWFKCKPDKAERLALTATRMISDIAAFGIGETYFTEMRYGTLVKTMRSPSKT
jgi:hypothetical protein